MLLPVAGKTVGTMALISQTSLPPGDQFQHTHTHKVLRPRHQRESETDQAFQIWLRYLCCSCVFEHRYCNLP